MGLAVIVIAMMLLSCHPKPVVMPGYFSAPRPANALPNCEETLACYARCGPPAEECMLRCEQCGVKREVARARAVSNCAAIQRCTDAACQEELCPTEMATCRTRHIGGPPVIDTFCPKE